MSQPAPLPCIYCGKDAGSPEHWLPRSLGVFGEGQVLHERLCGDCNGALGREVDHEFIRTGPEGVLRAALGVEGRSGDNPASTFLHRAATTHPVRAINEPSPEDPELLWETYSENGAPRIRVLEQIVVIDAEERRHLVPFNVKWTAAVLRGALHNRGIGEARLVDMYLDREHIEQARRVLSEVFPRFHALHHERSGAGETRRKIQFANRLTPVYFRGLAKIAFHGALKLMPHLDGGAAEFAELRNFVRHGIPTVRDIVKSTREPIFPVCKEGLRPRNWGHIVVVEADSNAILVRLQLFIGPAYLPSTWVVRLCGASPQIVARRAAGVFCQYLPPDMKGEIVELAAVITD